LSSEGKIKNFQQCDLSYLNLTPLCRGKLTLTDFLEFGTGSDRWSKLKIFSPGGKKLPVGKCNQTKPFTDGVLFTTASTPAR